MQDALPTTEMVILSRAFMQLADILTRSKVGLAFMRLPMMTCAPAAQG